MPRPTDIPSGQERRSIHKTNLTGFFLSPGDDSHSSKRGHMLQCVEGVILAAGLASRMGGSKLELEIDGIPVIVRVVRAAVKSGLDRVILVTGPHPSGIVRVLGPLAEHAKVAATVNPHPERGMSGSLIAGISLLAPSARGAMIILGDQPLIGARLIDHLLQAFHEQPDRIVAPLVRGRRSNPVIFPAMLFHELKEVCGDEGGRSVVKRNPEKVVGIEVGEWYDDADLDTPEDLRSMRARVMSGKRQEQ
jgi:molybdenum cofactor cytidylyltransferase